MAVGGVAAALAAAGIRASNAPSAGLAGRGATRQSDPLAYAQNDLSQRIAAIINSNAPDSYKKAALALVPTEQKQKSSDDEAWWQKGLNLLGKPKTLVVATLRRAIDPNANWMKDVHDNVGFGKIIEKANFGSVPYLSDFAKGLVGFVGDVALDPLTYLGVGLADDALKAGGKGARLFNEASKFAEAAGDATAATKFAEAAQKSTKGLSYLSSAERETARALAVDEARRLGTTVGRAGEASGGLHFKIPGTGKITGKIADTVGLPVPQQRAIRLLKQSDSLSSVPRAFRNVEEFARSSGFGKAASKIFSSEGRQTLIDLARRGDPEKARDAFFAIRALDAGPARQAAFVREAATRFHSLMGDLKNAGVEMVDVTKAAGGDENALLRLTAKLGKEKADYAANFSRNIGDLFNEIGGFKGTLDELPLYENHSALLRSDELKAKIGGKDPYSGPRGASGAGFERTRMKPGDKFLGQDLLEPSAHPEGLAVPDQMEQIAKAEFGDDYVKLFDQDFSKSGAAMIDSMGRRLRSKVVETELKRYGVGKDLFNEVATASAQKAKDALGYAAKAVDVTRAVMRRQGIEAARTGRDLEWAESVFAGSPEQVAVNRAEARVARATRELTMDPQLKAAQTRLRNANTAVEAQASVRAMHAEIAARFPEEADDIMRPYLEAVDAATRRAEQAGGRLKDFQKAMDDIETSAASAMRRAENRQAQIGTYASLVRHQARMEDVHARLLAEVTAPGGAGTPEMLETTRALQEQTPVLRDLVRMHKEQLAYLEAPELMNPAADGARGVERLPDPTNWSSARAFPGKRSEPGITAGDRFVRPMIHEGDQQAAEAFFVNHQWFDTEAVPNMLDDTRLTPNASASARKAEILKQAREITADMELKLARHEQMVAARVKPLEDVRRAAAQLEAIKQRMAELGRDADVKFMGELQARLPKVNGNGKLIGPKLETDDLDAAMNWWRSQDPASADIPAEVRKGVTLTGDDAVGFSPEGIFAKYLKHRAELASDMIRQSWENGEMTDELMDEISALYDDLDNAVFAERGYEATVAEKTDEVTKSAARELNELIDDVWPEWEGDLPPWRRNRWVHGTSAEGINLSLPRTEGYWMNADSAIGVHFVSNDDIGWYYGDYKRRLDLEQGKLKGKRFRDARLAHAELAVTNPKVYGPPSMGIELDPSTINGFDTIDPGEWVGGRAAFNGDVVRAGLNEGVITRESLKQFLESAETRPETVTFWNTVLDAFDETRDASEALRRAATDVMDELKGTYGASVDEALFADHAADLKVTRSVAASGRQRLPQTIIHDSAAALKGQLKAQGFDAVAYPYRRDAGWAVIVMEPEKVRFNGYEGPRTRRTIDVEGPGGTFKARVDGRKGTAFDVFDQQQANLKRIADRHDTLMALIDDARVKVGNRIDLATVDWKDAAANAQRANSELQIVTADLQARASAKLGNLDDADRELLRLHEVSARKAQIVENRFNQLEAELTAAEDNLAISMEAREAARAEMGVLQVEADHAAAVARAARSKHAWMSAEQMQSALRTQAAQTEIQRVMLDGMKQLGMNTQAPDHIVDAIVAATKIRDPKEVGMFLKAFDYVTSMFKSWAIMSPGFHARNYMGGVFNNFLAGVDLTSYKAFRKADRAFKAALESGATREEAYAAVSRKVGSTVGDAYKVAESSYAFGMPGQVGSTGVEAGIGDSTGSAWRAMRQKGKRGFLIDNAATRLNLHASEYVERQLRGTLALDQALKGATRDEILESVYKFHFNYDELSATERGAFKRLMPFYTWTRKNLPLQIEMLFTKPQYFADLGHFKNEMEALTPPEGLTPSWFGGTFSIRMPFMNPAGERMYLMPQLPPVDLLRLQNPREFLGQLNPIVKAPIEMMTGSRLYNGVPFKEGKVEVPQAWNSLGVGPLLEMLHLAERGKDGQLMTKDQTLYALEGFIPSLGKARRLFPSDSQESEKKYSNRVALSWLNIVFGLGMTANTESDKSGELYRRSKSVDSINKTLNTLGYGGYKELSRTVPMSRKPKKGEKSPYAITIAPKGMSSAYKVTKRGQKTPTGDKQLQSALRKLQAKGASSELQQIVNRIAAESKAKKS